VLIIVFKKKPSLRNVKDRKNIKVYVTVFLVFSLLLFGMDITMRVTVVGFGLTPETAYPNQLNQLDITGQNNGARTGNLYVTMQATNATFLKQQNYVLVNNSTIKVPFEVPWFKSQTKNVSYTIDENVTSYCFSFRYEQPALGVIVNGVITYVSYQFNETNNSYYPNTFSMVIS
jgi:hypothetical protein